MGGGQTRVDHTLSLLAHTLFRFVKPLAMCTVTVILGRVFGFGFASAPQLVVILFLSTAAEYCRL